MKTRLIILFLFLSFSQVISQALESKTGFTDPSGTIVFQNYIIHTGDPLNGGIGLSWSRIPYGYFRKLIANYLYVDSVFSAIQFNNISTFDSTVVMNDSLYADSLEAGIANINGGTIDGTVIGGGTPAAGSFTTADIDGGTIDGAAIGGASAGAGSFTTLSASGLVSAPDSLFSDSTETNYLKVNTWFNPTGVDSIKFFRTAYGDSIGMVLPAWHATKDTTWLPLN